MLELKRARAILTGASRGIGAVLAEALAARGVQLVLAARSRQELEAVAARVGAHGARAVVAPTDVADPASLTALVARARAELGGIDLLINNAGIESISYYEDLDPAEIQRQVAVNLQAPMLLSRLVLPAMLAQNRGHLVHIASLAGLGPAAFAEPYGATKAGLVGFSRSLRASLKNRGSAVSSSVICPGFITDVGMYDDAVKQYGVTAPATMGTSSPREVVDALILAVERDHPELIVNRRPMRPLIAVGAAAPRFMEWVVRRLRADDVFRRVADKRRGG